MTISPPKRIMVAATKQHCGKTTSALALMYGLQKIYQKVGFLKPVGQRHVQVKVNDPITGLEVSHKVDKDVHLFKNYFKLDSCDFRDMSPVVIPSGYTRDFLDGKITEENQIEKIKRAFENISKTNDYVLLEGTGHCGVGSIVKLDNARVAKLLQCDMVLVVNGGLGSAFDELMLNKLMCEHYGVKIRGVIINKIQSDKLEMIKEYFAKALQRWNIPIIGAIPDGPSLSHPTMLDFEQLFKTKMLAGQEHKLKHYNQLSLVAAGLPFFMERLNLENHSKTLFITHASRKDIVLGYLAHAQLHEKRWGQPFEAGLILAGGTFLQLKDEFAQDRKEGEDVDDPTGLLEILKHSTHPVIYAPNLSTYQVNLLLSNYTAKLSAVDTKRTKSAIEHYCPYIDFAYFQ